MSFEEFKSKMDSYIARAGVSKAEYSHDKEKGQYICKSDGLVFLGNPMSRKIAVKRKNHDMLVFAV